jgi:thiosulfate/3-mercaptopyruvate sulfurtransferase
MRLSRTVRLVAVLASLAALPAWAAGPREALVVTPAWLAQHLDDADLVLLHVGPKPDYDAAHIRGARYITLADLSVTDRSPGGLTLQMPAAEDLRQRLAAAGISNTSRIVVYFGHETPSVQTAARVILTMDYAGFGDRTSLLDGGADAWTRAGQPTTTEVPAPRTGPLAPLAIKPIVVSAEYVRDNLATPGIVIVDGRTPAFYSGAQTGGGQGTPHKTGHIAGAKNIPFSETVTDTYLLKPEAGLKKLFADAGVKPGDTVVAYCHIGQQATQVIFAARTLGYKVLLFDGSFEEWSRKDYPVEDDRKH